VQRPHLPAQPKKLAAIQVTDSVGSRLGIQIWCSCT